MREALCDERGIGSLIGVIEELMMGAYSTTSQRESSSAAAKDAVSATSQHLVSNKSARSLSTVISRIFAWLFFVGGIVGAVLGIAGLHVEITVAGLILACTAGLILLKLRKGGSGGNETD